MYLFLNKIKTAVRVICGVVFLSCKKNFDHIQIQYVHPYYGFFAWFILRKTSNLVTCLYGSDFYQLPEWKYRQQEKFYRRSTAISFTNEQMCEDFKIKFQQYSDKLRITRFGLDQLTEIDNLHSNKFTARELIRLPGDKVIVVCGHSSNIREQHLKNY